MSKRYAPPGVFRPSAECVPMPVETWAEARGLIPKPWPRSLAAFDLRWLEYHRREHGIPRPGRPALSVLWGWTDHTARALIEDRTKWEDPSAPRDPVVASFARGEAVEHEDAELWPDARGTGHADLVGRAVRWLRSSQSCVVVIAEPRTSAMSSPDAIGWTYQDACHHVEVKVSLSDFRADSKKPSRLQDRVIGDFRWYMTLPGVIPPSAIPEGWGLVEVRPSSCRVVIQAPRVAPSDGGRDDERTILRSYLRASQLGATLDETTGRTS